MNLSELFNKASGFAETYDGSEASYRQFFDAAIAYEQAGGETEKVDGLLDIAIRNVSNVNREEDFLDRLEKGGAKIFHHGSVFVRPNADAEGIENGEDEFKGTEHEPRLREVVMSLQAKGIYFDDLVIDIGSVSDNQMRKWPYVIVTIPRLNAQVAVADQKGEALFVANPAIHYMNWALFEKKMAGEKGSAFENITRIVHAGTWQEKMLDKLFGNDPNPGPKVNLPGYVKAQRKSKYPLTEEMIVEMAKIYRESHPKKEWPSQLSEEVDRAYIYAVTGDSNWPHEKWRSFDRKNRGLNRSLSQILIGHGCHYHLTEKMVVAMAQIYRQRHSERQWPNANSGIIAPDIIEVVTGDKDWQQETWRSLDKAGKNIGRGLNQSLSKILRAHGCHYHLTEEMVVAMARLYRERHSKKEWPSALSGKVESEIIYKVTQDKFWQAETWVAIDLAGRTKHRGLTRSLPQILDAHCPERQKIVTAAAPIPATP